MFPKIFLRMLILIALLGSMAVSAHAGVGGPFAVDANTLHLYHFDGITSDSLVANPVHLVIQGQATVTTTSYATAFGTALATNCRGTSTTNYNAGAAARTTEQDLPFNRFSNASTGAFTMEALVRPDVTPSAAITSEMQIFCGDNDGASPRSFQFRINKSLQLEFIGITPTTQSIFTPIPTTGNHAFAVGQWYHVAVTYDGNAGVANSLKMFWTKLAVSTSTANMIYSGTLNADIPATANNTDFIVGNENRDAATGAFRGVIDEARISDIARTPDQMIFAPAAPEIDVTPANVTFSNVNVIQNPNGFTTATVTISNTGTGPLTFQTQPGESKKGIKVTGDGKATIESVTPDTASPLAAGQSLKVVLKFLPTAAGFVHNGDNNHYYTLSIYTDDADESELHFPLRGIAVPVELSTFSAE